jgi:hypothetical protein
MPTVNGGIGQPDFESSISEIFLAPADREWFPIASKARIRRATEACPRDPREQRDPAAWNFPHRPRQDLIEKASN